MRDRWLALVICVLVLAQVARAQKRPEALERLEAYRGALRTAHVEWSQVSHAENMGQLRGVELYMTSKFADQVLMSINRLDEDGVVVRDESGVPSGTGGTAAHYRLQTDDGAWERMDVDLQPAMLLAGNRGVSDLRSLGVASYLKTTDVHEVLWYDPHPNPVPWRYEESREGQLHVVRVQRADSTVTYWLDPERAWSPVRVRSDYHKYDRWMEGRCSLKRMDGVWFPETVQFFRSEYEEGRKPVQIVRVFGATFNRPEHPQRLTLADIGVDVGTYVRVLEHGSPPRMGRWDGEQVLDMNEAARRGMKEGPIFKRQVARVKRRRLEELSAELAIASQDEFGPKALLKTVAEQPLQCESLWEVYTRKFIGKYKLNEDQTQKALSILRDCQQRGRAHLDAHSAEFTELEKRLKKLGGQVGASREKERAELRTKREKLIKPLERIFEQQLSPRLNKLPTRAQRKAAEQADSGKEDGD